MDEAVVLYPSPTIGHLISLVELGKHLLSPPTLPLRSRTHGHRTIQCWQIGYLRILHLRHLPFHPNSTTFPLSPSLPPPPPTTRPSFFEVLRLSKPLVHDQLLSISRNYTISGIIIDFLATSALSLATETTKSFRDVRDFPDIPGLPPIRGTDMVKPFLDREDDAYMHFLDYAIQTPKAKGIIINTFERFGVQTEGQREGGGSNSSSDDAVPDECTSKQQMERKSNSGISKVSSSWKERREKQWRFAMRIEREGPWLSPELHLRNRVAMLGGDGYTTPGWKES
ncbi:hypothetical protein OIU85_007726 [Salix viminalis]|uniref:Uncharacterized protein n=1 Tax=Salix viminalis TaxID=40686 RepID=A0A9Q0SNN4_SALVM|nr:hypothetical protein OIU85_007726 [Salix viminalis]